MKILAMTLGTRGDVQPFLALVLGLRAAGHDAVLVAPNRYADFATRFAVPFAGVDDGPLRLVDGAPIDGGLRARIAQARSMPGTFGPVLADCWAVARHSKAQMIVHNGQILAGPHIAEALGIPAVVAVPLPMYVPTRAFPWPGQQLPTWLPGRLNKATYLGMKVPAAMFGRVLDSWREHTLGLPRRAGRHDPLRRPDGTAAPVLHAFSPTLIPPPDDWPGTVTTTGFWFTPPSSDPLPDRVKEFLAAGPPPVYVGFGSMTGPDPAGLTATVIAAARTAGVRLILSTGWGGLTAADADDVRVVGDVDHRQLFSRTAAVVHHGGAGTTAAAYAAGRPQVICPYVADQPFWARLAHAHGVAPAPLPQKRLTEARLAAALARAISDPTLSRNAAILGAQIRAEHGVAAAAEALDRLGGTLS
jgi:sterol 3beta-glucosyltransferase